MCIRDSDGAMRTGWQEVWGKYYYLGNDGVMQTYWSMVDGQYYWLGADGATVSYTHLDVYKRQGYILPGVVSRKKQLIPAFIGTLQQNGN